MTLDRRAVELVSGMRDVIASFEEGRLPLDRLSWELKSRIAALDEFVDREWVDELRAIRNQVEVVNAFFIESGRSDMTEEERSDVEAAIEEMKAALTAY
jgi:hypothetical protein